MVDGGFNQAPTNTALEGLADEVHITGRQEPGSRRTRRRRQRYRTGAEGRVSHLKRGDASRAVSESVLVGAGAASLLVVGFTLAQASHAHAPSRGLLTALAFGSVALAWISVHTVYILRYARLYYSPPDGGIDFHGDTPDYLDFAYLGLTIGMTFQVSDTDLTGKRVRRTALHHALLSYIFGTVILAITVSSVAALLGR